MMRTLISILVVFICNLELSCQKEYVDKINQYNKKGEKEGYWIENINSITTESYYKNGLKSGIYKSYFAGKLYGFGEYTNGEISGVWYYFGDKGHLMSIQRDFSKNTIPVLIDNKETYIYPYKCYTISYYPDGNIMKEGILLWHDSSEMGDTREYGEWKFYDEKGNLERTKIYE